MPQIKTTAGAQFVDAIKLMTKEQLEEMRSVLDLEMMRRNRIRSLSFSVGDIVEFDARSRGIIRGVVSKINTMSLKVTETHRNGHKSTSPVKWKAASGLCSKV